jgi:hypothetical protein
LGFIDFRQHGWGRPQIQAHGCLAQKTKELTADERGLTLITQDSASSLSRFNRKPQTTYLSRRNEVKAELTLINFQRTLAALINKTNQNII